MCILLPFCAIFGLVMTLILTSKSNLISSFCSQVHQNCKVGETLKRFIKINVRRLSGHVHGQRRKDDPRI